MFSWFTWSSESALILSVFDFLLAGIGFLVIANEIRKRTLDNQGMTLAPRFHRNAVAFGFAVLSIYFAILTGISALSFFYHLRIPLYSDVRTDRIVLTFALAVVMVGLTNARLSSLAWLLVPLGFAFTPAAGGVDIGRSMADLGILTISAIAIRSCVSQSQHFFSVGWALLLVSYGLDLFAQAPWDISRLVISPVLLLFVLGAGEQSSDPLSRVFVRLNISFILLAGLIIFVITQTEKVEYLRVAEQRGLSLAEVVRGHVLYQDSLGVEVEKSLESEDVLRRIVTEFGHLQELRRVSILTPEKEVSFEIQPSGEVSEIHRPPSPQPADSDYFRIISLPMEIREGPGHVELWGTIEYINSYLGRHIVLIFSLFTGAAIVSSILIGFVTYDASRTIDRQYLELKRTDSELMHAAKLASIGELAGGVAHEINNPTTTILSRASFLLRKANRDGLPESGREDLSAIVKAAKRISGVTSRLLTFSRKERMEMSYFSVRDAIDDALALAEVNRPKGVEVRNESGEDLPPVLGNRDRMTEVFLNMTVNAFHAMPQGGLLKFSVRRLSGVLLEVQISDTGMGIAPADLPRIFDPFFTTKEPGRGTGLGLAISYAIVRDHGGRIDVRSSHGNGTTFSIQIPLGVGEERCETVTNSCR